MGMKQKLCWLSGLAAVALLLQGCVLLVAGAAGAGGYKYVTGELKVTEPLALDKVWKATELAASDLKLTPVKKEKDGLTAYFETKIANDKQVTIKLANQGEKITELRIRVGTFGDETFSRQIYEKIKSHY